MAVSATPATPPVLLPPATAAPTPKSGPPISALLLPAPESEPLPPYNLLNTLTSAKGLETVVAHGNAAEVTAPGGVGGLGADTELTVPSGGGEQAADSAAGGLSTTPSDIHVVSTTVPAPTFTSGQTSTPAPAPVPTQIVAEPECQTLGDLCQRLLRMLAKPDAAAPLLLPAPEEKPGPTIPPYFSLHDAIAMAQRLKRALDGNKSEPEEVANLAMARYGFLCCLH